MPAIRTFIALEIPTAIRSEMQKVIDQLKAASPRIIRWVPVNNIHLTLKFLGEISPQTFNAITELIQSELQQHQPFSFTVGGLGAFPNVHKPRTLWIGLKADEALLRLQRGLDGQIARSGIPPEERPFSPHLTIGRVDPQAGQAEVSDLSKLITGTNAANLGSACANALTIFRSDLRPGGAVYTPLVVLPFGASN
jgi:RNA 2',3'-cyclic 3'-phosphodiesterase